jgi:hypothetical protein
MRTAAVLSVAGKDDNDSISLPSPLSPLPSAAPQQLVDVLDELFHWEHDNPAAQSALTAMDEAGGSSRTLKRIKGFRQRMNMVVHGCRDARRRDAQQILRMFRAIGCPWLERSQIPGGRLALPAQANSQLP